MRKGLFVLSSLLSAAPAAAASAPAVPGPPVRCTVATVQGADGRAAHLVSCPAEAPQVRRRSAPNAIPGQSGEASKPAGPAVGASAAG